MLVLLSKRLTGEKPVWAAHVKIFKRSILVKTKRLRYADDLVS